ncbi:hypothetical protein DFQ27_001904 [Actinomortierella ambigua]|uniref:Uncharacterized protein n=1 Tax=Actinomortierella ambigua TaxID=1343610 RepID=A0A9P6U7N3_9FUNG|nr:hypothetical protein DFQ27_001904 [Actinomortierella ambigua]
MNKAARKAVNLSVLKRHDPNIAEIIDTSSYVVVYQFDEASQSWTKKGVEGTMFVFTRTTSPSFGFYIMNRLSIENFMVDLTGDLALQLTSDYIIYSDEQNIHGIWVYEPQDRDRIGKCLVDCCNRAKQESATVASRPNASRSSNQEGHASHTHAQTQSQPVQQQQTQRQTPSAQASVESTDDPLSRMLAAAMSKAKVSETSGLPTGSEYSSFGDLNSQPTASARSIHSSAAASSLSPTSPNGYPQRPTALQRTSSETPSEGNKGNVPGFLLAILAKEQSSSPKLPTTRSREGSFASTGTGPASGMASKGPEESRHQSLLDALTNRRDSQQSDYHRSPPQQSRTSVLSAELLPPSVLPSGLYPSSNIQNQNRPNGGTPDTAAPLPAPLSSATGPTTGSPAPMFASTPIMSRPNGMPSHPSPMQMSMAPFMHGPMNGGPPMFPPPPPPPFMNQGLAPPAGQLPPPPTPPNMYPGMVPPPGASFPVDALRASIGALGYLQQQPGFMPPPPPQTGDGSGEDVMSKQEFAKRMLELLQSDPHFMDALYSNYTGMLARR